MTKKTIAPATIAPASFDSLSWTSELYETVGRKATDTLSARAKGYKAQGLLAALLAQPIKTVVDTLTDTVKGLPSGTTKNTVVIRSNVAESDPVPAKCTYSEGQWITEQSTNLRQIHKQAITSAYASLAKRDQDGKDSYTLPTEWQGKRLSWMAAPGSKDDGFFTALDRVVKEEIATPVTASIEPTSYALTAYAAIRKGLDADTSRPVILALMQGYVPSLVASFPARIAAQKAATEKASAYQVAMARAKVKEQYAAFLSMGMSAATIDLALTSEHGSAWKVAAQIG
jgi:hypothetical protein